MTYRGGPRWLMFVGSLTALSSSLLGCHATPDMPPPPLGSGAAIANGHTSMTLPLPSSPTAPVTLTRARGADDGAFVGLVDPNGNEVLVRRGHERLTAPESSLTEHGTIDVDGHAIPYVEFTEILSPPPVQPGAPPVVDDGQFTPTYRIYDDGTTQLLFNADKWETADQVRVIRQWQHGDLDALIGPATTPR